MVDKLPFIQIAQSAICVPPTENLALSLDIKILPEAGAEGNPFYGVWLLDVSGSMEGDKINHARDSLIKQIRSLPEGTGFNLITFESEVRDIIKNETISDKTRDKIIKHLDKVEGLGGTALYEALKRGIKLIREYKSPLPKKIILITDGEPGDIPVEMGNKDDPNYQKYFLLAREALEYKGSIDTVGALGEHNVYLLYEIARQSTGKYTFAEDAKELEDKMLIASEQNTRIVFSQPFITVSSKVGKIKIDDMVQYKPTTIRMPFERVKDTYKTWLRSFEVGETYQFIFKSTLTLDLSKVNKDGENQVPRF